MKKGRKDEGRTGKSKEGREGRREEGGHEGRIVSFRSVSEVVGCAQQSQLLFDMLRQNIKTSV